MPNVTLGKDLDDRLNAIIKATGRTKSHIVQRAVRLYLDANEKKIFELRAKEDAKKLVDKNLK